jgi:dipeptidyl aminopeptidase/acylaminoacyl peptidase
MKRFLPVVSVAMLLVGCDVSAPAPGGGAATSGGMAIPTAASPNATSMSLVEARKNFKTTLTRQESAQEPVEQPPPNVFQLVSYDAPLGKNAAYLTPDPKDNAKHPAIVWITGGDCNTIGDVWSPVTPDDDQTAAAYRQAGIVMMFPSLRGGNQNPGVREGFLGEVDDVLAAANYLAQQPYVDPQRIYLGGHSTGGTLVLLVSECSDRFRAVFSFGPVDVVSGYGQEFNPYNLAMKIEVEMRSPAFWLSGIKSPTFVVEGTGQGNLQALKSMQRGSSNPQVHFLPVSGGDHFSILAPVNQKIAAKILQDTGSTCNLSITEAEVGLR